MTSLDGINGRLIQTLLRGENDCKQSDEFQASDAHAKLLFCLSKPVGFFAILVAVAVAIAKRRCQTRRFATTIFSATQRCNIVSTLFRMVTTLFRNCSAGLCYKTSLRIVSCNITLRWLQHCFEWLKHGFSIATLCCAKNRRCELSRVTSPLSSLLAL